MTLTMPLLRWPILAADRGGVVESGEIAMIMVGGVHEVTMIVATATTELQGFVMLSLGGSGDRMVRGTVDRLQRNQNTCRIQPSSIPTQANCDEHRSASCGHPKGNDDKETAKTVAWEFGARPRLGRGTCGSRWGLTKK